MPTIVSNAVGTEQQFTPRADNTYQGNYKGLSAVQAQSSSNSRSLELAQNMLRLSDALNNYMVSHERYKDEMGHIAAERMVNSETPDDIRKLNTIDAAQQYGYADASANPYFRAYAEKIRGGFLAARMKQEYDQAYSMSPAKSLEEEARRYQKFSSDWKANNIIGDAAPANSVAFNDGFDESQLVNMNTLSSQWVTTKHKEDIINTMASVKSKVGQVLIKSKDLLKKNGLLTSAVQSIFNEARLMGVPAENRVQLAEYMMQQLVATGHLTDKRFEQMADKVIIQTGMDGTKTKLSDILDMQMYRTAAAKYNASYLSEAHYKEAQKYIKIGGKKGFEDWLKTVEDASPEERMWRNQLTNYVKGEIEKNEARAEAARKYNLTHRLGAGGGLNDKTKLRDPRDADTLISKWLNYDQMVNGIPIASYKVDTNALYSKYLPAIQQLMADEDYTGLSRLLAMPQAKDLRETIAADLANVLNNLHPTDDWEYGTNTGPGNDNLKQLLLCMSKQPQIFTANFSGSLAADALVLSKLVAANGGNTDIGFRMFANYKVADKATREAADSDFDSGGFIDQGIEGVTRIATNGLTTEDMGLSSENNALLIPMMKQQYIAYRCTGMSSETAWTNVKSTIVQNFYAYHNGLYPRDLANNMGTGNDDEAFKMGLDMLCYAAAGDGNAEDVDITYGPNAHMIRARLKGTNQSTEWSIDRIREEGIGAFERKMSEASQEQGQTKEDIDETPDDINQGRETQESDDISMTDRGRED